MKVIGISGKIGTGKTTLTKHLYKHLSTDVWERKAFGDFLKEEVADYFRFPISWCYTEEGKNKIINANPIVGTVRQILQWWGTEVRRKENPAYWDIQMLEWLKDNFHSTGVIIDDIRFKSELELLLENIPQEDLFLIRLMPYEGYDRHCNHKSEIDLDDYENSILWDKVIYPSYGELETISKKIYKELKEKWLLQ